MLLTTEGVVIREKQVGENDKFIDVLTKDYGVIEISVRGVRKIASKSAASTQLFAYSKFCIQKRGERYYMNSCEPIHIFYELRLDVEKLSLASYFAEIIEFSVTSNEPAPDILRLLLNSLSFLTKEERNATQLKNIFELRILSEIGMMPDIVGCKICHVYSSEKMWFDINDGVLYCDKCLNAATPHEVVAVTPSILHAIRYIVLTEFDRLWNFNITKSALKHLDTISENYLMAHLGRRFKTLDFYKSLSTFKG